MSILDTLLMVYAASITTYVGTVVYIGRKLRRSMNDEHDTYQTVVSPEKFAEMMRDGAFSKTTAHAQPPKASPYL